MRQKSGKPLVLVADDDATTRYLYAETLAHEGFDIVEARNGAEALEKLQACQPDLVLLDVEMPVVDGFATCEAILAGHAPAPPVIMVTTHDNRASIDRAFHLGATDFIAKPIIWPLLGHRVRYILRGARTRRELGDTLDENRALLAALPDHILLLDRDGTIREHLHGVESPSLEALPDPVGAPIHRWFPEDVRPVVEERLTAVLAGEPAPAVEFQLDKQGRDGDWRECRFIAHSDDRLLAIVRDISERREAEACVHRLAYYDALTGLPNRSNFREKVTRTLERKVVPVAVFTVNVDRFKRINDTLGMKIGDEALIETSMRLKSVMDRTRQQHASSTGLEIRLAAFGGDNFALMLAGAWSRAELTGLAERLGRAVEQPMMLRGQEFVVTASIGVACSPDHGDTADGLIQNSEAARLDAKSRGSNLQRVYRSSMHPARADCLNLETDLRRALERDELDVVYQPKFAAVDGALVGAEALLRWQHPQRGWIGPETFIPIAEEAGLTPALTEWVAGRVAGQLADWQRAGSVAVPIALNVSAPDFVQGDVLATLLRRTDDAGISASLLELEITETVLMSEIESVVRSLRGLKEAGFGIAVDDFGTGYSSLRYLHRLPVDVLKIDYSFVREVEKSVESRAICSTIIALGHSLGLRVVGEGVETPGQRAFLEGEGCDILQGFLLGKPLPWRRFGALLQSGQPADSGSETRPRRLYCIDS